ncbi:hypothetical protein MMC14_005442 [Varicellaria rhodocarpa]|nr:hypothetical protein [Varicellaria rhodocarpa]
MAMTAAEQREKNRLAMQRRRAREKAERTEKTERATQLRKRSVKMAVPLGKPPVTKSTQLDQPLVRKSTRLGQSPTHIQAQAVGHDIEMNESVYPPALHQNVTRSQNRKVQSQALESARQDTTPSPKPTPGSQLKPTPGSRLKSTPASQLPTSISFTVQMNNKEGTFQSRSDVHTLENQQTPHTGTMPPSSERIGAWPHGTVCLPTVPQQDLQKEKYQEEFSKNLAAQLRTQNSRLEALEQKAEDIQDTVKGIQNTVEDMQNIVEDIHSALDGILKFMRGE